jgi:hypothetical protein
VQQATLKVFACAQKRLIDLARSRRFGIIPLHDSATCIDWAQQSDPRQIREVRGDDPLLK